MPRGFVRGIYVTDDGQSFAVPVDADYAADPDRGWTVDELEELPLLPRMFMPRRVIGIDFTGRQEVAIAATVSAPIWTGEADSFVFTANDAVARSAAIVKTQQERVTPGRRFLSSGGT